MADKRKYICPIFNLTVVSKEEESGTIIIDDSFTDKFEPMPFVGSSLLVPIAKEEFLRRENLSSSFLDHIPFEFIRPFDHIPAVEFLEESDKMVRYVENVEAALRLYKEGDAFCKPVWGEEGHIVLLAQAYEVPSTIFHTHYKLKKEDIEQVNKIFEKLQKIDFEEQTNLRVAITRLNLSYGKSMPTDKLLDFMIAFEALFIKGHTEDKGILIATGASFLMGKDQKERITIYNQLKHAYKVRDDIVHGHAETPKDIAKIVDQIENYLRQAILLLVT